MQFVVKYFPEIIVKSKPVRRQFARQLEGNLRAVLREIDPDIELNRSWDKLQLETRATDAAVRERLLKALCDTPGVAVVLVVETHPLPALEDIVERVLPV